METSKSGSGRSGADHERAERAEAGRRESRVASAKEETPSRDGGADLEDDITLGPGWMNRSGSRSLSGSREPPLAFNGKGGVGLSPPSAHGKLAFFYTKEVVLALHNVGDECPPDFLALPYILSQETLDPVNLSPDLLKDFEELQRKYLYNICPTRGPVAARGGRGRGRGRGRGMEPSLGRRGDKEGISGGGSAVYRPPRGRGRLGYSWDGENERRPAWADTPVDKDQLKGRFRGGRFRGDSDSEGSASEPEHEDEVFSDSEEVESDSEEAPGSGWMYKDPQNIVRGPFSNKEMHEWYLGGFFPRNLPVKREGEENFKPLSSFEGNPFATQRKKKSAPRREKHRDRYDSETRGERGGRDRGDWRRRSDKSISFEREREKAREAAAKKSEEAKEKGSDEKVSWRSEIHRESSKKEAEIPIAPSPSSSTDAASATRKESSEEVTTTTTHVVKSSEGRKKAEEKEDAKYEQSTKMAPSQPRHPTPVEKIQSTDTKGKRDSIDVSDAESLDEILDHFPHLPTDFTVSSDDEGEERLPGFLTAAGRSAPASAAPPANWANKAAWSAQELESRQFQQFTGGPGVSGPEGQQPSQASSRPHLPLSGGPDGKGPYMQPHHPMMGPGQTPQQFFPGMQPGFPPHSGHPARPGVPTAPPPGPHMPGFERRQGVFDMAAIEEQLLKHSQTMPAEMQQRMAAMQQPHLPHGMPHPAPWMMAAIHAKQGGLSLREIQEQELRERQRHPSMPPQAFRHQLTPEQMLHQQQMLSEQHKMHPLMRQQMAMGMRPPAPVDPVFRSVWGIPPEAPISLHELQARLQKENEEERPGSMDDQSVEQELHDQHRQGYHQKEEEGGTNTDGEQKFDHGGQPSKESDNEQGVWDLPAEQKQGSSPAQAQRASESEKGKPGKKQAQQQKKKASQTAAAIQQHSQKQKGGSKSNEPKPPSLREIQEQEQRETLEKQRQQKQTASQAHGSPESKNLQHLFSAWGFAPNEDNVWGSTDEGPSLKEIQEQEAARRELAQMEEQQKRRQQQHSPQTAIPAWTGGMAAKKPTLSEIQAEELKEQQKRQKDLQLLHKQHLKAQREQQSRWNSPWEASQAPNESTALSLREIQEMEQRKAREEASKRKKSSQRGGSEPITKLLWETRVGPSEPIALAEIMAQEEASHVIPEESAPKEPAVAPEASAEESGAWSGQQRVHNSQQPKSNLRDIQQEEQKTKQKKKGQQSPSHSEQKTSSRKQQTSQKGGNQKKQQQHNKAGVWGTVSQAPKVSLRDIQEKQQRVPAPAAAFPPAAAVAPKSAPAPVVEDDFWGAAAAPASSNKGSKAAAKGSTSAIIDDSHFPALGGAPAKAGGANSGSKKSPDGGQNKATSQKTASAGGGRTRLSSSSGSNHQASPTSAPAPGSSSASRSGGNAKAGKQSGGGGTKAGNNASTGKKKMQKLDPSLLGFSSNLQDRIAQGKVLPVDE